MGIRESEKAGLETLCRLFGYTRQAYYSHFREREREAVGAHLILAEVAGIRSVQKRIGTRKLYLMLTGFIKEHSLKMGRDAFFDLLRGHSLLVRRRKRRKPRTTYSALWMKRYPNLAKGFTPTGPNQLWVSDITYIRVGEGFAYLSVVTDAYSRKIVGYCLSEDLSARGCVNALRMAIRGNPEREQRLVHHSDRGQQYYSRGYMKLLKEAGGIRVSMSERSDPLENAIAERVNGILKGELLRGRFASFREARRAVDEAVSVYNNLRPHLSIDMLTPAEAHLQNGHLKRRWKNYRKNYKAGKMPPVYTSSRAA